MILHQGLHFFVAHHCKLKDQECNHGLVGDIFTNGGGFLGRNEIQSLRFFEVINSLIFIASVEHICLFLK